MSSLLLDDQKISPQRLLQLRHPFLYPKIEDALSNIIGELLGVAFLLPQDKIL